MPIFYAHYRQCLHKFCNLENNNNMNYLFWLGNFFGLLINFIFFVPINYKAKVVYDALKNRGKIQIKLFKLTIIYFDFSIEKGFIELTSRKKKKKILAPIILDSKGGFLSETDFVSLLIRKIRIQQGTIYVNFGAKTDAFATAMIVGLVKVITSILGAIIKSKKMKSKLKNKIYPSYTKDELVVCFKASIKISILKVLTAFIQSIIGKIKLNKEIMQNE